MRIIVAGGGRRWYCPDFIEEILNRLMLKHNPTFVIVHGGATGIDRSFSEACPELGVAYLAAP